MGEFNSEDSIHLVEAPEDYEVYFSINGFFSKKEGYVGINYKIHSAELNSPDVSERLRERANSLCGQIFRALERDGLVNLDEIFGERITH